MMALTLNETDALKQLMLSESNHQRLAVVRRIRNSVIGNRKRKRIFLSNGALPRFIETWTQCSTDVDVLTELAIVMGSLSHGAPEAVDELVQNGGVSLLLNGICHDHINVVSACLKALRSVYTTGVAPGEFIYQDTAIARQLVNLLSHSSPLNECAATILSITCQAQDHQHFLFANGIISQLYSLLLSTSPKVVSAGLQCLCSVIDGNQFTASACLDCMVPGSHEGETLLSLLTNLLSYSASVHIKINIAIFMTHLHKANALPSNDSLVTLKLIPGLVHLCKRDIDDTVRTKAASTLAELIADNSDLQEIASNTDCLLSVLAGFFIDKPNEDDEMINEQNIILYNTLRQNALQLLANLSSSVEDIRFKVITKAKPMQHLSDALECEVPEVKIAAARCLLSLSRSAKLLRTYLSDAEVWKAIVKMLSSTNVDCVSVSSSLACNLLLSFCPSREAMVTEGIIPTLSVLCSHSNPQIQLNAIWALMNCSREASDVIVKQIRTSVSLEHIIMLLQHQQNEDLVMKCLGLLMNLTQSMEVHTTLAEESDSIMDEHGVGLIQTLGAILAVGCSNQICEQALCVLVNLSSGCTRSRDRIAESDLVVQCLVQLLRTNKDTSVLMACCKLIQYLSDISHAGHSHRQNCLEKVGIQLCLQKLEFTDSSHLQEVAKQILELFSTSSL